MFDLLIYYQIIQHLKFISPNMYKVLNKEIMIHCPFCDDASRNNARNHGHLYFSIESPVFNCFRCNTSGTLISFLAETEFSDFNIINELKKYIKYGFKKNYFENKIVKKDFNIYQYNYYFQKQNPEKYKLFEEYIYSRIGNITDISYFLIYPSLINNYLNLTFCNSENDLVCWRNIDPANNFRYKMNKGLYFFQEKKFDEQTEIVLSEGPFDIINMYLYNMSFQNNFFQSIHSSRYFLELENLIIRHLLIGCYNINIVFDSNINIQKNIYYLNFLKKYNENISFKYWQPSHNYKDAGENPMVMEVT